MFSIKTYLQYEKEHGSGHHRRCIDGKMTSSGNCVGFCRYYGHKGFLTEDLRKEHNCTRRGCDWYLAKHSTQERKALTQSSFAMAFSQAKR